MSIRDPIPSRDTVTVIRLMCVVVFHNADTRRGHYVPGLGRFSGRARALMTLIEDGEVCISAILV